MEGLLLYSPQWSKKHKASMEYIRGMCAKLSVPLYKFSERIQTREDVRWLLHGSDDGFSDIVKKTVPKSFLSMPYTQAIDWLIDDPNNRFTSLLAVYINDDGSVFRLEKDLKGIKYFIASIDNAKKEESF